ncbi:hypothetical protein [Kushneria phosphatilytica]|uniref:Uncharacterized protein n=1 Tax=Kushneria phosphatilytica TaxID=657387 RepID=A0A1S1NRJ5_9GAMM|nr:hypothetical protein [Kushneria phosphatilytica]OHV07518.1 hypothetical protein BH688_14905 [Kushneria phosphatilytica]QEL10001.1 hypothetical protein FY550_01860 [Kushneria phosphatilytica]
MSSESRKPLKKKLTGRVLEEIGVVLNSDTVYDKGKREEIIARLRKEKGLSQEEAEQEVDRFLDSV